MADKTATSGSIPVDEDTPSVVGLLILMAIVMVWPIVVLVWSKKTNGREWD